MAQAMKDITNLGALTQAPYGGLDVPMVEIVRDVDNEYQTIFNISSQNGIDIYQRNPEEVLPMIEKNGLVSSYLVKEVPKLGLGGEYNTHVGVELNSKNIRAIEFIAAKEESYEAIEVDSIVDEDVSVMLNSAKSDYAIALTKERERKLMEQIKHSGLLANTSASVQVMFDELNIGFTAPADMANLTNDDIERICIALPLYFELKLGISKSYPVLYVSNKVWAQIVKSPVFTALIHDDTRNKDLVERNMIGLVHDTMIVRYSKLNIPGKEHETINMIAMQPGAVYLEETPEIRPVKYREFSEATDSVYRSSKVMDTGFISGTYQQLVFILDNYVDDAGTLQLTNHFIVFATDDVTFVQDPSLVHVGMIKGDAPTVHASVNRTLKAVVDSTYDNSIAGGGEVTPPAVLSAKVEALTKELEAKNAELEAKNSETKGSTKK